MKGPTIRRGDRLKLDHAVIQLTVAVVVVGTCTIPWRPAVGFQSIHSNSPFLLEQQFSSWVYDPETRDYVAEGYFRFQNNSTTPVKVLNVLSDCGCMKSNGLVRKVPIGESLQFKLFVRRDEPSKGAFEGELISSSRRMPLRWVVSDSDPVIGGPE